MSTPSSSPRTEQTKLNDSIIIGELDVPGMVKAARDRARHRHPEPLPPSDIDDIHKFFATLGQLFDPGSMDSMVVALFSGDHVESSELRRVLEQMPVASPRASAPPATGEIENQSKVSKPSWTEVATAICNALELDPALAALLMASFDEPHVAAVRSAVTSYLNALPDLGENRDHDGDELAATWGGNYLISVASGTSQLEAVAVGTAFGFARRAWLEQSVSAGTLVIDGPDFTGTLVPLTDEQLAWVVASASGVGSRYLAAWRTLFPEVFWESDDRAAVLHAAAAHAFDVWRNACPALAEMAGTSIGLPMEAAYASLDDKPLLILGGSGSGKELMAKAVHALSHRRRAKLFCVNLAGLPATTAASELFGHEKGAFTGATSRHDGFFQQANGGTLFLDEVDKAPHEVQAMLLRVLMDGVVRRLGENGNGTCVNVRVIAATSAPITRLDGNGCLLEDLAFRFQKRIVLPKLAERTDGDWRALWSSLTRKAALEFGVADRADVFAQLDVESLRRLRERSDGWPGNIRELENFTHEYVKCNWFRRLTVVPLDRFLDIMLDDAPDDIGPWPEAALAHGERMLTPDADLEAVVRDFRGKLVERVIARHGRAGAPNALGMKPSAFKKMLTRAKSVRVAAADVHMVDTP